MSTPSLTDNDFAILGVPAQFEQNETFLNQRWKELQTQMHPDRFATQGAAAQRLATQWSIRINEAYQNLKDPVKRAALLCEAAGVAVGLETNTAMPPEFLMQQMQWREALEEAQTSEHITTIQTEVKQERAHILAKLAELMDGQKNYTLAAAQVRALVFMDRFLTAIEAQLTSIQN